MACWRAAGSGRGMLHTLQHPLTGCKGFDLRFITWAFGAMNMQHLLAVRSFCLRPKPTLCLVQGAFWGMMRGP